MMRLLLALLLIPSLCMASAPTRQYNYVSHAVIDPSQNNANENSLYTYLQSGVDTYAPGSIDNSAVSASAGIAYSKLNLIGSITNNDINSSAAIAYNKLNLTGNIVNADINASAGIVDTKLATISTAGKISGAALTSLSSTPSGAGIIPVANLGSGTPTATKALLGDGSWGILTGKQVFTANGTFTAPTGITKVYLSMVGGGGGAYGTSTAAGPGGAGGNWVINYPYTVVPGNNYTVTIGAGGLGRIEGSRNATAGGDTSFDTITVTGGAVAANSGVTTNPSGLDASNTTGGKYYQKGGAGGAASGSVGGGGGGTPFGAGPAGGTNVNAGNNGTANTGAGGSGAGGQGNQGGDGGSGICIVMY